MLLNINLNLIEEEKLKISLKVILFFREEKDRSLRCITSLYGVSHLTEFTCKFIRLNYIYYVTTVWYVWYSN